MFPLLRPLTGSSFLSESIQHLSKGSDVGVNLALHTFIATQSSHAAVGEQRVSVNVADACIEKF